MSWISLAPIARVLADPAMLCVRSDARWKTVADLVADAKKRPGEISFGSSGNYGAAHVPFEMFQQAADIKLLHVPYRGGGPALTAFLGKQVDITAQAPGPITPHVQGGAARLLANWGSQTRRRISPTFRPSSSSATRTSNTTSGPACLRRWARPRR